MCSTIEYYKHPRKHPIIAYQIREFSIPKQAYRSLYQKTLHTYKIGERYTAVGDSTRRTGQWGSGENMITEGFFHMFRTVQDAEKYRKDYHSSALTDIIEVEILPGQRVYYGKIADDYIGQGTKTVMARKIKYTRRVG